MIEKEKSQDPENFQVSLKILLKKNNQYLLLNVAKTDRVAGMEKFDLPGGRINRDELNLPFHQLVDREVKEELGPLITYKLRPDPVSLGQAIIPDFIEIKPGETRSRFFVLFEAEYLSGEIEISDEHSDYQWTDLQPNHIEQLFTPLLWDVLKNYFDWNTNI
ncbi:MAG: NUDIX domain-containing protein [Candidatus Buchananbacteria bacterium]|nr:NUDIX domain-containing protein [Candidatus Buchananbacteria bacterium]